MGILDSIFKLVLKGKLNAIEKMGIPDDLKAVLYVPSLIRIPRKAFENIIH